MRICQQPVTVISICCNTFVQLAGMVKHRRAFLFLGMFVAVSVDFYVRLCLRLHAAEMCECAA